MHFIYVIIGEDLFYIEQWHEVAVNVLNFLNTFFVLFSNKMLVIRAMICKMLVRIANSKDPDQTASVLFA